MYTWLMYLTVDVPHGRMLCLGVSDGGARNCFQQVATSVVRGDEGRGILRKEGVLMERLKGTFVDRAGGNPPKGSAV